MARVVEKLGTGAPDTSVRIGARVAMTPREVIIALETEGERLDIAVPKLCSRAKVNRATWQRIKGEHTIPLHSTYTRLCALLTTLGQRP